MTDAFVWPPQVDEARLTEAMRWFGRARGRSLNEGECQTSWQTVAFTYKPDLRRVPRPYPETGTWVASLHSSGTTAEPVFSPWSEVDQAVADATTQQIHERCPSIQGARCAVIAPAPPLAAAHFMMREIELSDGVPFLIEPGEPERTCRALIDNGIEVVFTLPLIASRLGEYLNNAAHRRRPVAVSLVFCVGDVLAPARQSMLSALWEAPVLNMFGCSELFGPVAGPAEAGHPLVWCCEPVAVEVIDPVSMSHCQVGERGVLVLTTLWPKASPLQRYWTDDSVEVTQACPVHGCFAFHYIGRPTSTLQTPCGHVALRTIDELLLGSGLCGSEWSVRRTAEGICVEAEMLTRSPGATREVRDALVEMIGEPMGFVARKPGSLPRIAPKFRVVTA